MKNRTQTLAKIGQNKSFLVRWWISREFSFDKLFSNTAVLRVWVRYGVCRTLFQNLSSIFSCLLPGTCTTKRPSRSIRLLISRWSGHRFWRDHLRDGRVACVSARSWCICVDSLVDDRPSQPTIEGKRLRHSYVNSYDSSNIEEETMLATPGQSWLLDFAQQSCNERWRSELVGAMRACAFAARSKQKKIDPKQ